MTRVLSAHPLDGELDPEPDYYIESSRTWTSDQLQASVTVRHVGNSVDDAHMEFDADVRSFLGCMTPVVVHQAYRLFSPHGVCVREWHWGGNR